MTLTEIKLGDKHGGYTSDLLADYEFGKYVVRHGKKFRDGVTIFHKEVVPDPDKPDSQKETLIPVEGAIDIQSGKIITVNLTIPGNDSPVAVRLNHWGIMH